MSEAVQRAASLLYAMSQLVNQAVGDAVSDLLMVEAILIHKKVVKTLTNNEDRQVFIGL